MTKPASSREALPEPQGKPNKSRELAKEETRAKLIAAGVDLFARQGLAGPSLDAICAHAGFTRGAFYVHFKDRDDFIVAVMEKVTGTFMDMVIATGDAALDLERTIELFVTAVTTGTFPFGSDIPSYQFYEACARSPRLRESYVRMVRQAMVRVAHAVREGQDAETVRSDIEPEQVATILVAIVLGVQTLRENGVPFDIVRAAADVKRVLFAGGD